VAPGELTADLGGYLDVPRLPRKYECIRAVLGWRVAKSMQSLGPEIRWSFAGRWKSRAHREACR